MSPPQKTQFQARHYLAPRHWPTWMGLGLLRLITLLPYPLLMQIGAGIGWLMRQLMGCRRQIVATNLALAFPERTEAERQQLLNEQFRNGGRAIIESALSWWGSEERLQRLTHIEGLQHLQQAAAQGKGVILLSGHFTCFELGGRLLARHHPFQFIYKAQRKNPLFEHYTTSVRLRHYLRAVTHHDTRGMLRGLKQRLSCWYLPDQDFGPHHSLFVPFMGVETATITATSRMARMTGAIVVPYYPLRRDDGTGYDIHILPPLEGFPSHSEAEDCRRLNQILEQFVVRAPAQYLWLHRRFRTRPPGEAGIYPC